MATRWIFSVLLFWVIQTETEGKTIFFSESTCSSNYLVESTSDFTLVWDGGRVKDGCDMVFTPVGDSETVCVEASSFNIADCSVQVKYDDYFKITRTYGCSDYPTKYCGNKNADVHVQISTGSKLFSSSEPNSIYLRIYNPEETDIYNPEETDTGSAEQTDVHVYNPVETNYVGIIVLVGFAVGFIVFTVVIILVCRRKRSAGTILSNSGIPHTRLVNCPDSAPFSATDQQPYPGQEPVTREYTVTVPVAVNFS